MSSTATEDVIVARQTQYGFQDDKGGYYSISKLASTKLGLKPESFQPGPATVEVWISDGGKKYVNKIISGASQAETAPVTTYPAKRSYTKKAAPATSAATPASAEAVKAASGDVKFGRPLSDYERETDVRIHVSGLLQAIISSPALTMAPDILNPEIFKATLDSMTRAALEVASGIVKERLGK